jgi:hypothetical protein
MIGRDRLDVIRDRYGQVASWAVWAPVGAKPKSGIADLDVLDPDKNPGLIAVLHARVVLVGLNISRPIERPFGNFHDGRPSATDYRLRAGLLGTACWGAYMTDAIKDFENRCSHDVMGYLRSNPAFEEEQIDALRPELDMLGPQRPTLIALGRAAEEILRRRLTPEFAVIGVPHYAARMSIANYRAAILDRLRHAGID